MVHVSRTPEKSEDVAIIKLDYVWRIAAIEEFKDMHLCPVEQLKFMVLISDTMMKIEAWAW